MKKLIAVALLVPTLVLASPGNDGCVGNCDGGNTGGGTTSSINTNTNTNTQGQLQGQSQSVNVQVKPVIQSSTSVRSDANSRAKAEAWAASQSSSRSSANALTNDSVSISTGGVSVNTEYPERQRIYSVPGISLAHINPSANCHGTTTIGGSGVGFGLGFGTSWPDDDCGIRETARFFDSMGLKSDAVSILCTSKYAVSAPICQTPK